MLCPSCQATLTMAERQGIEIDYCPACRGVWLDRGELDKIIERSAAAPVAASAPAAPIPHGYDDYRHGHRGHKRRKSFLEELFD